MIYKCFKNRPTLVASFSQQQIDPKKRSQKKMYLFRKQKWQKKVTFNQASFFILLFLNDAKKFDNNYILCRIYKIILSILKIKCLKIYLNYISDI